MIDLSAKWRTLSASPHRLFFAGGFCQGIMAVLWWLLELGQRFGGMTPLFIWKFPAVWAHAFLMVYGFFPFFIFGFLFTFFPNWLDSGEIPRPLYLVTFAEMGLGNLFFFAGLLIGKGLLVAAVCLLILGWGVGIFALFRIFIPAPSPEKKNLFLILLFLLTGAAGLFLFSLWFLTGRTIWLHLSESTGLWFFLLPLVVTVSHLVIPFFSRPVIPNYRPFQPFWILVLLLGGLISRGLLDLFGAYDRLWFSDLIILLFAIPLTFFWGFRQSLAVKMLFILHLSFAWLSIGALLDLIQNLTLFISRGNLLILGKGPLHALTLGLLTGMVIAMATRVTFGHSGRKVVAVQYIWRIFLMFQGAALLRVFGDLFPAGNPFSPAAYSGSALLWIGGLVHWLMRYGSLLWEPPPPEQIK
jgi:uncharacterized protein involved in response to NO